MEAPSKWQQQNPIFLNLRFLNVFGTLEVGQNIFSAFKVETRDLFTLDLSPF